MSVLLVIRSADDVRSALEAASEFLVYRRKHSEEARQDEVLGIWLRRDLDAGLSAWLLLDPDRGAGMPVDVPEDESGSPGESGVCIRESISLSGLWTLCWFDGTLLRTAHSATERRRTILDSLLSTTDASRISSATETFFPVFAAVDAVESINTTMSELEDRYPHMIGGTWFLDDRESGIVPARR